MRRSRGAACMGSTGDHLGAAGADGAFQCDAAHIRGCVCTVYTRTSRPIEGGADGLLRCRAGAAWRRALDSSEAIEGSSDRRRPGVLRGDTLAVCSHPDSFCCLLAGSWIGIAGRLPLWQSHGCINGCRQGSGIRRPIGVQLLTDGSCRYVLLHAVTPTCGTVSIRRHVDCAVRRRTRRTPVTFWPSHRDAALLHRHNYHSAPDHSLVQETATRRSVNARGAHPRPEVALLLQAPPSRCRRPPANTETHCRAAAGD
mmetsp:Transcript_15191/g.59446  ORF Transcript_15191/g.59446 Transcript_15191/m.59446 type:complete len:256 (+) Transcript_15191:648-1415(+)